MLTQETIWKQAEKKADEKHLEGDKRYLFVAGFEACAKWIQDNYMIDKVKKSNEE